MNRLLPVVLCLLSAATAPALAADASPPAPPLCSAPDQPVAFEGFAPIGGIEQWVTIDGERCDNPVVLVVHGGPGNPLSPFAAAVFEGWTRDFTLVQWDQRGAGRTFGRDPGAAEAPLSLERMAADGVEVAAHAARALGQEKVILFGSSWGSALAVHMAKARPSLFHAYLGASQLVQAQDNLAASHARLATLATEAGDAETLATLQALGAPPWTDPRAFGQLRRITRRYEARSTTPAPDHWWQRPSAYSMPADLAAAEAGEEHSYLQFVGWHGDGMLSRIDLAALGPSMPMPVVLVHGEQDLVTTPEVARRWFDGLEAPRKEFILVPATGHDPNVAMVEAEHRALMEIRQSLSKAAAPVDPAD